MGVCLPIEFGRDGDPRGMQEGRLGMKSVNWRKDLKECAAEEGGNEQMHVPGGGGQGLEGKIAWGGSQRSRSTRGIIPQGLRERQTSH